jgi:hypothetical protein
VTQQFHTTTSMGRLTLNVLLSFAQFERGPPTTHCDLHHTSIARYPLDSSADNDVATGDRSAIPVTGEGAQRGP